MLIYLDESEFFKGFHSIPANLGDMTAFLGITYETFKVMASVYGLSGADWAKIEGALESAIV